MNSPLLAAKNITVRYGTLTILENASFELYPRQWLMIAGPNGAGKSTLLNAVSQAAPYTGEVELLGKNARDCKPRELARAIGLLAQNHNAGYDFSVEEVVRLGRYAYQSGPFSAKGDGQAEVDAALAATGMSDFASQSVLTLSGGELQRTFLAQLIAQDPQILLLDEPTNHLDLVYQKQTFALIRDWINDTGRSVVSVVHDLSLARAYGTHALLLSKGRVLASGSAAEVLSRENLKQAYSMDVYEWMNDMLSQWR